jgi:hypothetical protein
MLAQALCGRHALAKRPFYDLYSSVSRPYMFMSFQYTAHTFMVRSCVVQWQQPLWVLADQVTGKDEVRDCDDSCEGNSA